MSYEYKALIEQAIIDDDRPLDWEEGFKELDEVYAKAAEYKEYRADTEKLYNALKAKGEKEILKYKVIADECEANLNEVKKQLKIKIRHARRDGDYSEAYAFSEALDMIGNLI